MEGNWGEALVLTLWGMIVIGGINHLLRPILVGKRLKLHTVLACMSVVGGLMLFGPAGIILGPVVLTVTMALLEIWRDRAVVGLHPIAKGHLTAYYISPVTTKNKKRTNTK